MTIFAPIAIATLVVSIITLLKCARATRKANAAVANLLERQAAVLDATGELFFAVDRAGIVQDVNKRALEACGSTRTAMIGRTFADVLPELAGSENYGRFLSLIEDQKVGRFFLRSPHNGHHYEIRVFHMPDGLGIMCRDVTARIEAQRREARSAETLRAFFEMASEGHMLVDQKTRRIQRVNKKMCEILQYDEKDLVGRDVGTITHPDDRARDYQAFALLELGQLREYATEKRYVRKDGTHFWAQLHATIVRDGAGRILGAAAIVQDITEHRAAIAALRHQEERLRVALEASRAGTWDWDVARNTIAWSDRIFEIHGLNRDTFDGKIESYGEFVHPDDRERFVKTLRATLEQREPFRSEHRIVRPDGTVRWITTDARTFFDDQGKPSRMVGATIDCTDRKRQEEEIVAASVAKSTFIANMSHEIRTPLGAILGFSELLLDPDQTDVDRRASVDAIRRNGELLGRLVNDVLDLSKVEAGKIEVERLPVAMADFLEDLSATLGFKARSKGIVLAVRSEQNVPEAVLTDPTRLRQIVVNVAGNAVKFTSAGSVDIGVTYDLATSMLTFRVQDTGVGLDANQTQRLFSPFTQADSSTTRKFGGTGLGLSLSRNLARVLGGDVFLERSAPGAGSTFVLSVKAPPAKPSVRVPQGAPMRLDGVHVLVVDDAPDNQQLVRRILMAAGAEVGLAATGEEGVSSALAGHYNVVLMDMQMPGGMDGYEATKALRERGYQKPVVALTANALEGDRQRAIAAGCAEYLTKPISRNHLVDAIARLALS